ncbi:AfsR/SARP family transcriptional regulator [Nocardia sp. NPDC003482]
MALTEIGVLGPLRLAADGVETPLAGAKLRGILVLLALGTDRFARRDELIEELGLCGTTKNATNALHAHVARLRRWLADDGRGCVLETLPSGYRLHIDPAAVDATRFTAAVDRALALADRGGTRGIGTPSVVAAMLEEALGLWRGDALADTADGPRLAALADELHRVRAVARETLLDAWLAAGRPREVALAAPAFIADDPLDERFHEQFVDALQRLGRYAEAVEAYQRADRLLRDELGVAPGPGLRTLVHAMIGGPYHPASAGLRSRYTR